MVEKKEPNSSRSQAWKNAGAAGLTALNSAAKSRSGRNAPAKLGRTVPKKELRLSLTNYVRNKPIRGDSDVIPAGNHLDLIASKPMEGLYQDYIDRGLHHGGVLVVQEAYGEGKSYAVHAVARARTAESPKCFLVVCQGKSQQQTGDEWYATVAEKLGAKADTDPASLAASIYHVMSHKGGEIETDDKHRIDVPGLEISPVLKNRSGLLVLEDLDPDEGSFELSDAEASKASDPSKKHRLVTKKLGKAGEFIDSLAYHFNDSTLVAIVTTKNKDVALALHHGINDGKCGFARSLLSASGNSKGAKALLDDEYIGFGWNEESKFEFLSQLFGDKIDKETLREFAADGTMSIRDCVHRIITRHPSCIAAAPPLTPSLTMTTADSSTEAPNEEGDTTGTTGGLCDNNAMMAAINDLLFR